MTERGRKNRIKKRNVEKRFGDEICMGNFSYKS
jgi:hypothetical protein